MTQNREPTPEQWARSRQLTEVICQAIRTSTQQCLSFADFMALALYTPELGFYSAAAPIFGAQGDFFTAPELSPLFSRCLARYCQPILTALRSQQPILLELGAGTGKMAADILLALEAVDCLPEQYWILERSQTLKLRQQTNFQKWVPHLVHRIVHIDQLPTTPIQGIILANEVVDALPVHTFVLKNNLLQERRVAWDGKQLHWQLSEPSRVLAHTLNPIHQNFLKDLTYYASEVNLGLSEWISSLGASLKQGCLLLIDYGYAQHEYYHPQRLQGTLRCHYQQLAHDNPLILPGLQDITSHVDFTRIAEASFHAGFEIEAFTSQAAFLLACGLLAEGETCYTSLPSKEAVQVNRQLYYLLSPGEMGELCKVMVLKCGDLVPFLPLDRYNRQVCL